MSQQINLYSQSLETPRNRPTVADAAGALVAALALLAALGGGLDGWDARLAVRLHRDQARLAAVQLRIGAAAARGKARRQSSAIDRQVARVRQELAWRQAALQMLGRDATGAPWNYAEDLSALARQALPGLWLTEIDIGPDGSMDLSGQAVGAALVPQYIHGLDAEPALRGRTFATLDLTGQDDGVAFRLRAATRGSQ